MRYTYGKLPGLNMTFRQRFASSILRATGFRELSEQISSLGLLSGLKKEPPRRGTPQIINGYNELPWLRVSTNKVARSVADVTWRTYAVKRNGKAVFDKRISRATFAQRKQLLESYKKAGELQEVEDHPALDVLYNGNEYMVGNTNILLFQIYLDLVGEAFALKERNHLGVVVALWILPPHWIRSLPSPSKPYFEMNHDSFQEIIPMNDIIWAVDPNPLDPYGRGGGGARALSDELETDEYAAKHTKSWFYNSARPDIIVSGDGLGQGDTERLEEKWLERHQGFLKRFKPFFLSKAVSVKELSQTFQSMQLIDLRKFERDTIHQFWGIPPEILGITESSNRATIESADYIFGKHVTLPRAQFLQSVFQNRLIVEYDERLILDFDSPVAGDKEYKLKVFQAAPWAFSINQWKDLGGEEKLDNGDVYMVPFNLSPTESIDNQPGLPGKTIKTVEHNGCCDPVIDEGLIKNIEALRKQLTPKEAGIVESVVVSIQFEAINDRIIPIYEETLQLFGEQQADLMGTTWIPSDPQIQVLTGLRYGSVLQDITNSTRDKVRSTLTEGIANGELLPSLVARIESVFKAARKGRAKAIARTETVNAANVGAAQAMRQGGIEQKQWISVRDERVRESHSIGAGLDGQIVGLNDNFVSPFTGATGPYPTEMSLASESVNCRCFVKAVIGNIDGMTEDHKSAYWKTFESDRMPREKKALNAARDGFSEQEKDAIKALRGNYNEQN